MTAPVYTSPNVLDQGLNYLKTKCNSVILMDNVAYAAGDSYASVRGTADANIVCERTGVSSVDITLANQGTLGRKATIAAPSSNPTSVKLTSGTSGSLKYVALDTVGSEVLQVWDCTSDPVIAIGNQVIMPALILNSNNSTG